MCIYYLLNTKLIAMKNQQLPVDNFVHLQLREIVTLLSDVFRIFTCSNGTSNIKKAICTVLILLMFPFCVNGQLAGSYTIGGTSPDYGTLTEAVTALNQSGISAPVTFNLRTGEYDEQVSIEEILGASETNTITFQSESNNSADVIIKNDASSAQNYLIKLDGTDNVIIRDLSFESTGTLYNNILVLQNNTNNITISNCNFDNNNRDRAIFSSGNSDYRNLTIENCDFQNGPQSIYLTGSLKVVNILNNQLTQTTSSYSQGIYTSGLDSLFIRSNEITSTVGGSGIYVNDCVYTEIEGNQIYLIGNGSGLYLSYVYGASENSKVFNNVISTTADGIYTYSCGDMNVYFNSVRTESANISHEAFYIRYSGSTNVFNNIFANEGGGFAVNGYLGTGLVLDYNNYYSTGTILGKWDNINIENFSDWQANTMMDANSVSANPIFTSADDLHTNQALLDGTGFEITGYSTDIEGTTRNTPPDIGAYEFTATGDNVGISSLSPQAPLDPGTYPVTIELFNNGPSTVTTDSLYWTVNDVAQTPLLWTGNLSANNSETVTLGNFQFDETIGYEIEVWSSSPNGQSDIDTSNDTLIVSNLYTSLNGDYTVGGTSPDFATLTDAQKALNSSGLSGAVRLLLRNGTYEEQIVFNELSGSSETNTLTIQAESGNAEDVIIQYDSPYNSNDYYIMKLNETDNVVIQNLTFKSIGSSYNLLLKLQGETNNIDVSNCVFDGNRYNGIRSNSSTAYSNINISNNTFNECSDVIYFSGPLVGLLILNNIITTTTANNGYGLQISNADSVIVHSNIINNTGPGMYIYNCDYLEIEKNELYLTGSGIGINLQYVTAPSENSKIVNNVVSTFNYGIYLYSVSDLDLYYNSFLSESTNANNETFYFRYSNNLDVKNNIFVNTGLARPIRGFSGSNLSFDHNNYFSPNLSFGYWDGAEVNDLAGWQFVTGFGSNSLEVNPVFAGPDDLHPNQSLIDGAGVELVGYNEDIEGTTRNNPPDMGAYEFTATGDNVGLLSLLPQTPIDPGTYPVSIELFNNGPSVITTDSLYWTVNDVVQSPVFWTGNLAINSSETVTLGDYQFDEITGYEIKVWSSNPNGQLDIDTSNDTLLISNIYTTLAGDYTVGGTNPDFETLTEASNALNNGGMRDSVRLLIRSGTYEEQFDFSEIYGSSEINILSIQSETGNAADVIIQYNSPYNSNDYYLMKFDGTDNVFINNITFEPLGNNYNLVLKFVDGTNNVCVSNCVFNGNNNHAIYARDVGPNFNISNNEFYNGSTDIDIRGAEVFNPGDGDGVAFRMIPSGVRIEDNLFMDGVTNSYNISISLPDSITIRSNEMYGEGNASGIVVDVSDNVTIEKNLIYFQGGTGTCINLYSLTGLVQRSSIVNNFLVSSGTPLYLYNVNNANIYFNSIRNDVVGTNYPTIYWRYCENLNLRNNIFANEGGGIAVKAYPSAGLVLDYNNYYTTGAVLGVWDNSNIANFTDWEFTTQQDANSISTISLFQANNDLHTGNIALNAGVPIAGILDDIDGDIRNSITPYIGADESPIALDDIGIVNLVSPSVPFPQGTNELVINVVNNFTTPLNSATINWVVDNDTMTQVNWTGNIPSGTSDNVLVGTYQFDVAQPYDLKFWLSDPNGITDSYNDNDTLEVLDLYAALIGTYTIGSDNADFETIAQAVEALEKGGVVGEVIFNIQDGTYQENIKITEILGASATNNITFQSESLDSSAVIISNLETSSNTVFEIDSTDYISLKHLTFEQSVNSSYCIRLSGSNDNVSINNCHFNNNYMAVWIEGLVDNFEFTENNIDAGVYGIYCNAYNISNNVLIEENTFTNQSNHAIRLRNFSAPIIQYNKINVSGTIVRGIYLINVQDEFKVIGNELYLNDGTVGIRVETSGSNSNNQGLIGNNFISINGTGNTYGLEISGSYINIFHNNILVESPEVTNGRAIQLTGSYNNLKNNIFANTGGGFAIYANNDNTITESDYNDFYAPGGRVGYWNGNRSTLANWQAGSGFDANSFDVDPEFTSSSDLHISQQLISEKGTPVDGLPEDIDGDFRNPLTPDIGADEFTSLVNNIGVIEILTPITGCDISANDEVTIVIKNPGSQSQSNFDVAFQLGEDAPIVEIFNQTLAPGFTANHTFTTPIDLVLDSIYTIKAYTLLTSDELNFNDTTTTSVISYPPVNISISPDATIDYGDTLILTASGGTNYVWSGELEGENPYSPTLTVAPFITQTYQMTVTDDNGCEATESVTITVNPIPELPDLVVSNVNSGLTTVQSGDPVTLTWDIGNIGDGFAFVDWTEKIYIQSPDGSNRTIVGQINYDGTETIAVNETLNRSYDLNLPDELSIGDQGVFVVEIVPNILELPQSTANNIAQENQAWTIERILYLSIADLEILEGGGSVYCIVSRSSSTASSLTVNIDLTDSQRFNFPSQLTIYSGQAGRSFYISASENDDLEGDLSITMTATAANFTSAEEELLLIDDETPSLSIDNLPATIAEGEVLSFDVSTNFPPTDTLFVNIISSEVADVPLPTPVAILPGNTSVNVQVTLPNDDIAEPDEVITITAGSAGINAGIGNLTLTNDEDIPAISFEITIDTISESAGLYATQGIITR